MILPKKFFQTSTPQLAEDLLGTFLVHDSAQGRASGRIVETEAYLHRDDPASHAFRGMTKRNAAMFGNAGTAYIYLIYGMYHCFNVVSGIAGEGEAVLIRALEPLEGIPLMQERRGSSELKNLCSGPGKLVLALGITRELNGVPLQREPLTLHSRNSFRTVYSPRSAHTTVRTARVGISKGSDLLLRFYIEMSPFISRR